MFKCNDCNYVFDGFYRKVNAPVDSPNVCVKCGSEKLINVDFCSGCGKAFPLDDLIMTVFYGNLCNECLESINDYEEGEIIL